MLTLPLLLSALALAEAPDPAVLDGLRAASFPRQGFQAVRRTPFRGGDRIRVAQTVGGLPVWGGDLVVALDPSDGARRVVGEPLERGPAHATPSLSAEHAIALAEAATEGAGELWPAWAELGLIPDHRGGARLVWRVELSRQAPLGAWRAYVDARTGALVREEPTLRFASGRVYATNPDNGEPIEVDLGDLSGKLAGDYATTRSCDVWDDQYGCTAQSAHATPDEAGDFLFEPDPTSFDDPMAEVMMYYHLDTIGRWYEARGFRHTSFSGMRTIQGLANIPYENAFFGDADGDGVAEVAFGQGSKADFAYDADVIYHEYSHSVYNVLVNPVFRSADEYGYDAGPGGLDEGSADLFAIALSGDPRLGEYAGRGFGLEGPVRDLEPDLRCPYDIYGETHEDGMIWASLGWNLVDDPLLGGDLVAELMLGALASFPSDVSFGGAGEALEQAAGDLLEAGAIDGAQHAAILAHGEASGIIGCGRVIPLDEGDVSTQWIRGRSGRSTPLYTQFSLTAPELATRLAFRVDDIEAWGDELGVNLYVRRGEHVVHELQEQQAGWGGSYEVPVPVTYDFVVEAVGAGYVLELTLDELSEHPLEPGATYYFAVASQMLEEDGRAQGEITISGEVDVADPPEEERALACGCASGGAAPGWGALGLLGLRFARRQGRVVTVSRPTSYQST